MSIGRIFTSVFILLSFTMSAQIGAKIQQKSSINGVWENNQAGFLMTLILNQDGSGELDGEALTFTAKDNKLTIVSAPQPVTYSYVLQDNSLQLSGGDLNETITFTRHDDKQTAAQSTNTNNQNGSATSSGSSNTASNNDIVGVWSASAETVEFKSNGQCAYLGQLYPFEVSPGHVTLTSTEGKVTFEYSITGDQLSLTYNNNTITYTRKVAGTGDGAQQQSSGKGQVAQELVGKWCFVNVNSYNQGASSSSECVTLNADGTYQYNSESSRSVNTQDMNGGTASQDSDQGTWYVQDNRLYVHSRTKGETSYTLEKRNHPQNNDPMIVIDGRTFVTSYNKPPWR